MHACISEYDIMLRHSFTGLTNCIRSGSTAGTGAQGSRQGPGVEAWWVGWGVAGWRQGGERWLGRRAVSGRLARAAGGARNGFPFLSLHGRCSDADRCGGAPNRFKQYSLYVISSHLDGVRTTHKCITTLHNVYVRLRSKLLRTYIDCFTPNQHVGLPVSVLVLVTE